MNNFEPLKKPWLEEFHINKYVKKYDGRQFNRPVILGRDNGGLEKSIKRVEFKYRLHQKRLDSLLKSLDV
jgi:hypothetical protein